MYEKIIWELLNQEHKGKIYCILLILFCVMGKMCLEIR